MKLLDRKWMRGILVVAIPFYIIGFFILGNFLGERYGNKSLWIIGAIFLGLITVLYDIYIIIIRPTLREKRKLG